MTPDDLCFMPATELAAAIRAKTVSPVEVMEAVLARVEAVNPKLNAFTLTLPEQALQQAKEAEAAVARGGELPPLLGVPLTVKDLVPTKGIRTMGGSKIHENRVPEADAPMVTRLKQAGAIMFAKTTTPEFGWKALTDSPVSGMSHNPWDKARNPGGSSGGAAAAAAAGFGPLHTGGDGAGSIRVPASFCGVFGIKPSFGRVPYYPAAGEQLSHLGPITRTVADGALMLSIIAGQHTLDRFSLEGPVPDYAAQLKGDLRGLKVAWSPDLGFAERVDPQVAQLSRQAARAFEELGCAVEEVKVDWGDPFPIIRTIWKANSAANLRAHLPQREADLDPGLVACAKEGLDMTAAEFIQGQAARNEFFYRVHPFFDQYDLLLTPTVAELPLRNGELYPREYSDHPWDWIRWAPFSFPFNLTHQPAATVPAGFSQEGLPVGLQIVGKRLNERLVLQAAAAYEEARPWAATRPAL